ncbi:peptidase S8/S53 domain-containing protein [Echria macrotheca]|uniref:Peptidase S8/S53 domain-containing protein n=1 Tax=Echria macrotheca TaxID=438768 RepID=A0AAJ0BN71_9PEZI|nr:peptidase S8/S53 domain-containing protein [Echria macrotheca]
MSSADAIINGKTWSADTTTDQQANVSTSGYILLRTTGSPLNKTQKRELKALGVDIHQFHGGGGENEDADDENQQQIYLCGHPKGQPLEPIRDLAYIDFVDVYPDGLVVHDAVERLRARPMRVVPVPANNGDAAARAADFSEVASARVMDWQPMMSSQMAEEFVDETVEVDVLLHHDVGEISEGLLERMAAVPGFLGFETDEASQGVVRLRINENSLDQIAALDEVRVIHPVNERVLMANVARRILGFASEEGEEVVMTNGDPNANGISGSPSSSSRYRGADQIICVADTGFDKGSTTDVHDAFVGRVNSLHAYGRPGGAADDPDGHGTHVCGCVLGRGTHALEGYITGTAPAATLMLQSFFVRFNWQRISVLGGYPADLGVLFAEAYKAGARIHTNSWGTPPSPKDNKQRPYDGSAESIDKFVWNQPDMTVLFAAGNDGQDSNLDGRVNERSLGAEASAKNCITVGASENLRPFLTAGTHGQPYTYGLFWPKKFPVNPLKDDHQANNPEGLAAFSSRGPTAENRIKPDVVAPGTAILSTRSRAKKYLGDVDAKGVSGDDGFLFHSGTSMATPLVAGCCAVLREALLANGYKDVTDAGVIQPTGALIKALLINGALQIKGQYMPREVEDGPNPHSGFGRVNIAESLSMIEPDIPGTGEYGIGRISEETEEAAEIYIPIPEGDNLTFKITMTYPDLPGASLANDLNLVVVSADGTKQRHGNKGDQDFAVGATKPFDRRNNVEQIVWPHVAGDRLKIVVKPYRIMMADVPFAYAWKFLQG